MKTIFIITTVFLQFHAKAVTPEGPGGDIPEPVTHAFSGQFPNDRLKDWDIDSQDKIYIARFKHGRQSWVAFYSPDGRWEKTEIPVRQRDLPAGVRMGWRTGAFSNWYLTAIKKVERPGEPEYLLQVNNSVLLDADHSPLADEYLLRYSAGGSLIEKKKDN